MIRFALALLFIACAWLAVVALAKNADAALIWVTA